MDRLMGWLLVIVGAVALAASREPAVLVVTLVLLAAGPLGRWAAGARVPAWVFSTSLTVIVYLLPWPISERMTLILAAPIMQYWPVESMQLMVAGAAMMVIAGQSKLSSGYVLLAVVWAVLAMGWLALRHAGTKAKRGATRRLRLRDWVWVGVQIALTVAFAAGTAHGLPALEHWLVDRAVDLDLERQSGFSTRTDLNGVESIRNSSKVALRIFDPGPYLMRGQGYGTYRMGVWTSARAGVFPQVPPPEGAPLGASIRVQSTIDANAIAFAPLEWGTITASAPVQQDVCRVATTREATREWSFQPVRSVRNHEPLSAKDHELYLQVPPEVETALRPLLTPLLRPGMNARQKVQGLLYFLNAHCEYSLDPGKPKGEEPVVRFLTRTRKGHCEYFAASLALLARMAGVPSRYMTGYAAVERNAFGGYLMARDSDAHAWTEIWFEGEGWTTWDATPTGWQSAGTDTTTKLGQFLRELADYLSERWETLWEAFSRAVLRPLGAALGALGTAALPVLAVVLVFGLLAYFSPALQGHLKRFLRWLRARWASTAAPELAPERRAAATALTAFEDLLAPLGLQRGQAVTPAELAARLDALGQSPEACAAARELVDLFCRFRYGGGSWDAARAAAALDRVRAHLTPPGPAR